MLRQPTIQDWLEPQSGRVSVDAWRAIGALGEAPMLTVAMECARRADAKSLTALFEHLAQAGHGPELNVGARFTLPTTVPDYRDIGEEGWADPKAPLPTSVVDWKGASFEVAVAVCLARHWFDGKPQLPRTRDEDFLFVQPQPKAPFNDEEKRLLVAAIDVFRQVPAHGIAMASGVARLFFEISGRVDSAETAGVFLSQGLSADDIASAKRQDSRNHIYTAHRHALSRGCIHAAHAISELSVEGAALQNYRSDQLYAFISPDANEDLTLAKLIESLREEEGEDQLEASDRFAKLIQMVDRLMSDQAYGFPDRLSFAMKLVDMHVHEADKLQRSWCDVVVDPMVEALARDKRKPEDIERFVGRLIDVDRHQVHDWFGMLMKSQCAPMVEFLQPALPKLLEDGAANEDMTECFQDLGEVKGWSILRGPDRLRRCVEALDSVGAAPLQPFERAKRAPEPNPVMGQTTLLHSLARNPRPNQIEAMLVLVELGADPLVKNSAGHVAAQGDENWEAAWRSHRAREAAALALDELNPRAAAPR